MRNPKPIRKGRPTIFERPMTNAERQRRYRLGITGKPRKRSWTQSPLH